VDELVKRDFLHNRSRYGMERLIQQLEVDNKVYWLSNKLYAKKEAAKRAAK